NEEIYLIKGAILNNLQQHKAALEVFKHLLTFTEFKEDAYYQMALTYNYMQDLHGAIHYLKNCLFENKKNTNALEELCECFLNTNRTEEALTYFQTLIDNDPYNTLYWYYKGQVYQYISQFEEALNCYSYCHITNESFVDAYIETGHCLMMMGEYEKAIDSYKQSFEFGIPDTLIYEDIAKCYDYLENFEEARNYYKKAIKSNPELHSAWYGVASTLADEERWYESIHYVKKAIEVDSTVSDYWFLLADCERELGNIDLADEAYRKVMEMDPDYADIWIEYPEFLYENNQFDAALEYAKIGVKYFPYQPEITLKLASLHYRAGNLKESYNILEEAVGSFNNLTTIIQEQYPELLDDVNILKILEQTGNQ
ncbi:MAG: tetratricopeptide repeat protein, partial [Bacteroidetes bacterium]|nr:tetratricopeptide repeat protein [Bacteroidota bacterium]